MGIKRTMADDQFSLAVRASVQFICEHCSAVGTIGLNAPKCFMPREGAKLDCAHIFGRRDAITRWDMMNAVCLCSTCHRTFTENPLDFFHWIESYLPGREDLLREKRRGFLKGGKRVEKEVAAHYRVQLALLGENPEHRIVSYN